MKRAPFYLALAAGLTALSCSWLSMGKNAPATRVQNETHTTPGAAHKSGADTAHAAAVDSASKPTPASTAKAPLSPASELLIRACDNYLVINPKSPKVVEVLGLKAATYYNNKAFDQARDEYQKIIAAFPKDNASVEATRMVAQSYYEQKEFDKAQDWYRKLREKAPEGGDKSEAAARIAESIYRIAEALEQQQRFKDAAEQYERCALEFPDARIADVALFNAGTDYEKETQWAQAVLQYQRLCQRYLSSENLPKALFRTAKCYEKLSQWEQAAQTYLRVTASYPRSDLAPAALYNAGFCFESAGKLIESAAALEKMVELYPSSPDAADVLFKAGELYGKLKDWENVTRVNLAFAKRFGNDTNRVVQAQCMVGIALYMQSKEADALVQLQKTIATFNRISQPSTVNKYYAAKAQYTMGEILQLQMNRIELVQPQSVYKRNLTEKSGLLDQAVAAYSGVVRFAISEWTTRGIFSAGQSYEDFAKAIFKQERPQGLSLEKQLALELGIAQAVEDYLVNKALHYHEQNVKLAIKEKLEDKYVLDSRTKLVFLPFSVGKNYLMLADIAQSSEQNDKLQGFALIAAELQMLQKVAPFQERAIELFLKSLENGATYQEYSDYYKQASGLITSTSFKVGENYSDISIIAREAPVPETFDPYEAFVYKTKLLQQIETYEDQALKNYLKTVKIAEAYKISDEYVTHARERVPQVLFLRGRCYDLLGSSMFTTPPYPGKLDEAQKEEYKARFEEVGMKFQDQSAEIYRSVLDYAEKNYAQGEFVTHAYVRLFQTNAKQYGIKQQSLTPKVFTSGPQWKCSADSSACWSQIDCSDSAWSKTHKSRIGTLAVSGFPADVPIPMWCGQGNPKDTATYKPADHLFFRLVFYNKDQINQADLYAYGVDRVQLYLNGAPLAVDSLAAVNGTRAQHWSLMGLVRDGKNVVSASVTNVNHHAYGFLPYLKLMTMQDQYLPKPPGYDHALDPALVAEGKYAFPFIKNFSPETPPQAEGGK